MGKEPTTERRSAPRRARDRALEGMAMEAKQIAERSIQLIEGHIATCTKASEQLQRNVTDHGRQIEVLGQTIQPIADYHQSRVRKEEARALAWESTGKFFVAILKKGFEDVFGKVLWLIILALLAGKTFGLFDMLEHAGK